MYEVLKPFYLNLMISKQVQYVLEISLQIWYIALRAFELW